MIFLTSFFLCLITMNFFEIVVYNEEVLLLLCFCCFILCLSNIFNESVFQTFDERTSLFKQNLIISFEKSYFTTKFNITQLLFMKNTKDAFSFLEFVFTSNFIKKLDNSIMTFIYSIASQFLIKFNEIVILESKFKFKIKTLLIQRLFYVTLFRILQKKKKKRLKNKNKNKKKKRLIT